MGFDRRKMSFEEADRRYAELRRQHDAGAIGDEEFNTQRKQLMVQDDEGRWWAKSRKDGEWCYRGESGWVRGTPPGYQLPQTSPADDAQEPNEQNKASFSGSQAERPSALQATPPDSSSTHVRNGEQQLQGSSSNRAGFSVGLGIVGVLLAVGLITGIAAASSVGLIGGSESDTDVQSGSEAESEPETEAPAPETTTVAEEGEPDAGTPPPKTDTSASGSGTGASPPSGTAAGSGSGSKAPAPPPEKPTPVPPPEKPTPEKPVPNVVGRDAEDAIQVLQGAGFKYDIEMAQSDKPAGTVVSTDPPSGTPLDPDAGTVTIKQSEGPSKPDNPKDDCKGKDGCGENDKKDKEISVPTQPDTPEEEGGEEDL